MCQSNTTNTTNTTYAHIFFYRLLQCIQHVVLLCKVFLYHVRNSVRRYKERLDKQNNIQTVLVLIPNRYDVFFADRVVVNTRYLVINSLILRALRTASGSSGGVLQHSTAKHYCKKHQHQHNTSRQKNSYPVVVATASGEPSNIRYKTARKFYSDCCALLLRLLQYCTVVVAVWYSYYCDSGEVVR